jgi:hypothetical protein
MIVAPGASPRHDRPPDSNHQTNGYVSDQHLQMLARLESSGLSIRQATERLRTIPPQLHRLLDPTNDTKSARQIPAVLALGGDSVKVTDAPGGRSRAHRRAMSA